MDVFLIIHWVNATSDALRLSDLQTTDRFDLFVGRKRPKAVFRRKVCLINNSYYFDLYTSSIKTKKEMPKYRRARIPGGTYFFTVVLANRKSSLLVDNFDLLASAIKRTKNSRPFRTHGWVVLPDHIHTIWTLPKHDSDFSGRWRVIKKSFTRSCKSRHKGLKVPFWQNRFWEHAIRGEADLEDHLNYIHINPLKHGYVQQVKDWPYSSFHHYVEKGFYPHDWGGVKELDDSAIESGE